MYDQEGHRKRYSEYSEQSGVRSRAGGIPGAAETHEEGLVTPNSSRIFACVTGSARSYAFRISRSRGVRSRGCFTSIGTSIPMSHTGSTRRMAAISAVLCDFGTAYPLLYWLIADSETPSLCARSTARIPRMSIALVRRSLNSSLRSSMVTSSTKSYHNKKRRSTIFKRNFKKYKIRY